MTYLVRSRGIPPEKSAEAIVAVPLEGQSEGLNNLLRQTLKMYVSEEKVDERQRPKRK